MRHRARPSSTGSGSRRFDDAPLPALDRRWRGVAASGFGPVVTIRTRVLVSGRVQGVWFRDSCRREAQVLGVSGWVRNRADGRVEIEVEGEAERVERLVAWARTGPRRAQIDSVETKALDPIGETDFSVL